MSREGRGVSKNYQEALKWFRLSAEQKFPLGQNNLGSMYDEGLGVPQDYNAAIKWYRLSAEQGSYSGQNSLGYMYEYGQFIFRLIKTCYDGHG